MNNCFILVIFFVVPKGYVGEWETQGGEQYYYELSVIATKRPEVEIDPNKRIPYMLDRSKLSGMGITREINEAETYRDVLFEGVELTTTLTAERSSQKEITTPMSEQLICVIAGRVKITPDQGESQTFYAGDFFVLPNGFVGDWESSGHHLFRCLRITRTT